MLDRKQVSSGQFESSHLLGTFRQQQVVSAKDGKLRYAFLEMRMRENETHIENPVLRPDESNFGLPVIPYKLFDELAAQWSGTEGNCSEMEGTALEVVANYGSDHSDWHPGKALACWQMAMDVLQSSAKELRAKNISIESVRETLVFNMRTVREQHFHLYNRYS